ncbi:EscE/YscE/SsaE family type III secretion system needle protein co-chaperone [Dongshaea marina]|uniref:EscE/YscE/SsaE family type III secretion system needle protein co-chaperone n=1 Tax=Dongshaea marina TaxID=2047966 RepID=UPI000D3E271A|nr:EscE/YscE/SsaE family type III secretion system needle protein co-chaperone [Dongshaea marina]
MPSITQLEDRLKDDQDGIFLSELIHKIDEQLEALSGLRRGACKPEDYQKINHQIEACAAGRVIIRTLWGRYHKRSHS